MKANKTSNLTSKTYLVTYPTINSLNNYNMLKLLVDTVEIIR